jgi:hypothetical protein
MCIGRRKNVNRERKGAQRKEKEKIMRERGENDRKKEVNKDVEREEGRI